jgi:hypothetical protein
MTRSVHKQSSPAYAATWPLPERNSAYFTILKLQVENAAIKAGKRPKSVAAMEMRVCRGDSAIATKRLGLKG